MGPASGPPPLLDPDDEPLDEPPLPDPEPLPELDAPLLDPDPVPLLDDFPPLLDPEPLPELVPLLVPGGPPVPFESVDPQAQITRAEATSQGAVRSFEAIMRSPPRKSDERER
jgi:hypothetical protein